MILREWLADVCRKAKTEIILMYFFYLEVAHSPKTIRRVKALREVLRFLKFVCNWQSDGGDYE
ncbi:hypothetical protein C8D85_3488 [Marinomonas communis]|uniref:Uncharacterized protein n=1 Tax=Marinomonas communis TaxID=28254 RepID=A0A4R6WXL8_9GAMM|nr:hypothetical protein C8D85_3488 [Marinomonas communis]